MLKEPQTKHAAFRLKSGNTIILPRKALALVQLTQRDNHQYLYINGEPRGEISAEERDRLLADLAGLEIL